MIRKFLVLIVLIFLGCKKDNSEEVRSPELSLILNNFVNEASNRGMKLNVREGVRIQFGRIEGTRAASCRPNSFPKIITIDSMTWKHINAAQKERLVFHELAHCLLMRPHFNDSFESGECKSWMREDESKCVINLHNAEWRRYYLDELFTPSQVSIPYWFDTPPKFYDVKNLTISQSVKIDPYKFKYFDSTFLNNSKDWIIDFKGRKSQLAFDYIAITLNELVIEGTFVRSGDTFKPRAIVAQNNPINIVLETTAETTIMELSLRKQADILFIYFSDTLCYRIPIRGTTLKIGTSYCSFPQDNYTLDFYAP
jgi:hypothetical protein